MCSMHGQKNVILSSLKVNLFSFDYTIVCNRNSIFCCCIHYLFFTTIFIKLTIIKIIHSGCWKKIIKFNRKILFQLGQYKSVSHIFLQHTLYIIYTVATVLSYITIIRISNFNEYDLFWGIPAWEKKSRNTVILLSKQATFKCTKLLCSPVAVIKSKQTPLMLVVV